MELPKIKAMPGIYGENKIQKNIRITETAWTLLGQKAKSLGVSRSELIEQYSRGMMPEADHGLDLKRTGELCVA